jgi:DNA-binding CsgD family transcriptional regulator
VAVDAPADGAARLQIGGGGAADPVAGDSALRRGAALVVALSAPVGAALRRVTLDRPPAPLPAPEGPGLMLFDPEGEPGSVAVVIEPAHGEEIAPIIVEAYALSPREQEVTRLIARGAGTAEIAATLFVSPHTVRDYVKAVFEKVGVSSRGELTAKLFAEHYTRPLRQGAHHVDGG